MHIDVRPARRGMVKELAAVLGRAFHDDPMMVWMLPDAGTRAAGLPRLFAAMARHHFLGVGASEVAGSDRIGAAALWAPPGRWKQTRTAELLTLPAALRVFGLRSTAGRRASELMKQHHPEEPHWYLGVIGSDPTVRGQGYAQALLRSRLERIDAEHAPTYLECTNPDNVGYYQRFGFEVSNELMLPDDGPRMWLMWRPAR